MTWKRAEVRHQEEDEAREDWIIHSMAVNAWIMQSDDPWSRGRGKGAICNNHVLKEFMLGIWCCSLESSWQDGVLRDQGTSFFWGSRHRVANCGCLCRAWPAVRLKYRSSGCRMQASLLQPETSLPSPESGCVQRRNSPLQRYQRTQTRTHGPSPEVCLLQAPPVWFPCECCIVYSLTL